MVVFPPCSNVTGTEKNAVLTFECLAFFGGNAYVAVFTLVFGCEGQLRSIIIEFPVAVAPHGIFSRKLGAVKLVDSAFFTPLVCVRGVSEQYVCIADDSRPYLAFGIGSQNVALFILYEGKLARQKPDGCFAGTAVVPLEEASAFVSSMDADSESVCGAVESCGAADGSST